MKETFDVPARWRVAQNISSPQCNPTATPATLLLLQPQLRNHAMLTRRLQTHDLVLRLVNVQPAAAQVTYQSINQCNTSHTVIHTEHHAV